MRVKGHNTCAVYTNALRHNSTPNEVILDLGINTVEGRPSPTQSEDGPLTLEILLS